MGITSIKPQSLAVPVPVTGMSISSIPILVPSSSTSSTLSGSGSASSSSDQGKTIRPVFTLPHVALSDPSGKKDKHSQRKGTKGKGKGPTLITPSLNPLGSFNALGGLVGVLTDQRKQLAFVEEEDDSDPNRDRWDDDFDLGEEDEDFAARSKIDATKSKLDIGLGNNHPHSEHQVLHETLSSSSSSEDDEDETLTSSSKLKARPRERDDRTIRASPGASFSRLPSSSHLSRSPSRTSPSTPPVAALIARSTSDTVTGASAGTTYHAISEAEEENYDDDFVDDDDGGNENGEALLERRTKAAFQRLQNQQGSNNSVSALSRPLFHPDDIKSALFPHINTTQITSTSSSPSGSTSRPSLHGRTYSASAASSLSSSPFSAPLPTSPSGVRRPQLTLPSSALDSHKRVSPGPLTAPLPSIDQGDDVWDADYEDEYDYDYPAPFSAGHNEVKNGTGKIGSIRSPSASQQGSIRSTSHKESVRSTGSGGGRSRGSSNSSEGRAAGLRINGAANQRGSVRSLSEKYDKYTEHPGQEVEAEDFDYKDNDDSPASTIGSAEGGLKFDRPGLLKLNSRLSNRSWLRDEDDNSDEDVFAEKMT
ncbi:hypothetical protein J3R30DRAFT_2189563 [Lentinula aciculospora]|uniref:Uncharacterized protein n=1 Tax=Lentinula aciculospora TaxID=153920 RepID=A0A9W9AH16_9AGAR|nr:hypothetical protein J3R30DRAFT_2189563 [Lentinula aciculospora]